MSSSYKVPFGQELGWIEFEKLGPQDSTLTQISGDSSGYRMESMLCQSDTSCERLRADSKSRGHRIGLWPWSWLKLQSNPRHWWIEVGQKSVSVVVPVRSEHWNPRLTYYKARCQATKFVPLVDWCLQFRRIRLDPIWACSQTIPIELVCRFG